MSRSEDQRRFTRDLLRLARLYRRELDRVLAAHDLTEARALPVINLARLGDGVRQGVLAEALGIEGPSLVRLIDQLCAAGLVERRADPADGRVKALFLTDPGRVLSEVIEPEGEQLRAKVLSQVSDEDLAATLRVFAAFEAALRPAPARQSQDA